MSKEYKRMIIDFSDPKGMDIFNLITQYRYLTGRTWKQFVLESIADNIHKDNEMVASAIYGYIHHLSERPQSRGRPVGYKMTSEAINRIKDKNIERWEQFNSIKELGEEDVKQQEQPNQ